MSFRMNSVRCAVLSAAALALVLVTSCGGSSQIERFTPGRLIVFGDEHSLLDDSASPGNARKYGINATVSDTDPTLVCGGNENWVQVLASFYGFVFEECNPAAASVKALMHAGVGVKVADIPAQVAQVSGFVGSDLVTVLAGANDILDQYRRYPGVPEAQLKIELEATGEALAAQVNAIADAGGKVLIATVPDLGLSPFALAERAAHADIDRAALLSRLTERFNARLRAGIYNDGRRIGLLLADELVQSIVKFPATYGFVNVTAEACLASVPAPSCTTWTLQPASGDIAAASQNSWLWANGTFLSPGAHRSLGALAATRATNNPF
jgi:outer membrane lipase/esterase